MYDDLLGDKKKSRTYRVDAQVYDWDDEKKELILKKSYKLTVDDDGNTTWEDENGVINKPIGGG